MRDSTRTNTIGVYWGRFNPPHKGHMAQILACLKLVDKLVVAVGSAEHKNEKRNPFSGAERVRMMRDYLREQRLPRGKVRVVAVNDAHSYQEAVSNMLKSCGKVDVVFINRKEHPRLVALARKVVSVRMLPYSRRVGGISSGKIRDAIAQGKKWGHMTGSSVAKRMGKKGIARIKACYAD